MFELAAGGEGFAESVGLAFAPTGSGFAGSVKFAFAAGGLGGVTSFPFFPPLPFSGGDGAVTFNTAGGEMVPVPFAAGGLGGVVLVPSFFPFPSPLPFSFAGGVAVTFNDTGGGGAAVPFNDARPGGGGGAVEFEDVMVVLEIIVAFPLAKAVAMFVAPCVSVTVERTVVGGKEVV